MERLVVLYQSKDGQKWCSYVNGQPQAKSELEILEDSDPSTREVMKIKLKTTAELIHEVPA